METHPTLLNARSAPPPRWLGGLVALGAAGCTALWLAGGVYGLLALGGLAGAAVLAASFRWPILPLALLLAILPFNYGQPAGGAVIKLSEAVSGLMLATAMLRLAVGDAEAWRRVRHGLPVLAMLGVLGGMAIATAAPRPNVFNVRYEIQNEIALAYGLLFFRRRDWPLLIWIFAASLAVESAAALAIRFGLHQTGLTYASPRGGMEYVRLTADDLADLAGGRFRLAGTMGHKNLLAAYLVLLLPLTSLELLRRPGGWLLAGAVLGPALAVLGLTDSMTGWGALVLLVAIALVHLRRFDYFAVLVLVMLPVAGFALFHFGGSIFFRIGQIFGRGEAGHGTVSSRVEILGIALRLIGEHPWFGIGRENFMNFGQTYYSHAHNMFLMKAIEMGLPGGVMFGGFIVGVLAAGWRSLVAGGHRLAAGGQYYRQLGVWLGCLGFTAMNLFDYSYANFSLGPLFMLMLGIMLAVMWDAPGADGWGTGRRASRRGDAA